MAEQGVTSSWLLSRSAAGRPQGFALTATNSRRRFAEGELDVLIIQKQIGKHKSHVFTFKGKTITQVSTKTWYAALERAGIEDFRWHDLRHTWASWHVQSGTPLFALQEMDGWESPEMVRRYAHLAADHLAPYADRLSALRTVDESSRGTNVAQGQKDEGATSR